MANSPEARTTTGEIIDQAAPPPAETTTPESTGAPETYADFKLPEGATLDSTVLAEAAPIFKELNLSQDQAQKLVDIYTKNSAASLESATKAVTKMRTDWIDAARADKDIGSVLDTKVLPSISKAIASLPEADASAFREAMNFTGAGDHPAVIKALYHFAQKVNEGTHVTGGNPSPHGQSAKGASSRPTLATAMYPNLPQ